MPVYKLKPACKDYLWGGDRLKKEYHKEFAGERLAETWELSCHPDGPSVIAEGPEAGLTLPQYIEKHGKGVLGSNCQIFQDFPILIKFIDARDDLSIQVHPNNIDALEKEHQYGKTEMWYVLEAEEGAYLYYGFKRPLTQEEYRRRIRDNTLEEVLNAVPVQKGDMFYIPAGTVHAICKGMVIAEIQQNSNVTYRVYDHGRVGAVQIVTVTGQQGRNFGPVRAIMSGQVRTRFPASYRTFAYNEIISLQKRNSLQEVQTWTTNECSPCILPTG